MNAVRLICPRCRRLDPQTQRLRCRALRVEEPDGEEARPGGLDGVAALRCEGDDCRARYPVVRGIPIIFAQSQVIDPVNAPLLDPLALPAQTLCAALAHHPPDSPLASSYRRLSQYAWAAFRDWMSPQHPPPVDEARPPFAVTLMAWLRDVTDTPTGPDGGLHAIVGAGPGREAWEAETGATLLIDAHLPSLLLNARLRDEGHAALPIAMDASRWAEVEVRAPRSPKVATHQVCCDIHDPPFEAEVFSRVSAVNLIDSVANPFLALGQCHALTAPGGCLTLTSPFRWQREITPQSRWFESIGAHAETSAEEALEQLAGGFDPPLSLRARARWPWWLRVTAREAICYQSEVMCFDRPDGDPERRAG